MLRIVLVVAALACAAAWTPGPAAGLAPRPRCRAVAGAGRSPRCAALAAQHRRLPVRASALESDDAPADATAALDAVEATPAAALKPRATGGPSWPEVWVQRLWTKRDFLHAHAILSLIHI